MPDAREHLEHQLPRGADHSGDHDLTVRGHELATLARATGSVILATLPLRIALVLHFGLIGAVARTGLASACAALLALSHVEAQALQSATPEFWRLHVMATQRGTVGDISLRLRTPERRFSDDVDSALVS